MKSLSQIYEELIYESTKDEIWNQMYAFKDLMGKKGGFKLEKALIDLYGAEFRKIIDEFKKLNKGTPTADQLIWIAGVHTKKDPREVANKIKIELGLA